MANFPAGLYITYPHFKFKFQKISRAAGGGKHYEEHDVFLHRFIHMSVVCYTSHEANTAFYIEQLELILNIFDTMIPIS